MITTTTGNNGRLGNQIIRNLAVSLIAKKHDLKVIYHNKELIEKLGITLYSGNNVYGQMTELTDNNYFTTLNSTYLDHNLNPNNNYFQTKEITNHLYTYITDFLQENIISKNNFNYRYNNNNDLFIHIRLGDVSSKNPGLNYYANNIKKLKFDNLYISTDSNNHTIITNLLNMYPNAKLLNYNEIETLQFGSTCKYIILSHGSFSALIGYLAFFSYIYYPEYDMKNIWYGDMFSIKNDNWYKTSY